MTHQSVEPEPARPGEFGSWQGTAQIPLPQFEPLDRRWFEIAFPLTIRQSSGL
jgi:hypothetical protein